MKMVQLAAFMQQQHISLKDFESADNSKTALKRYDRTKYLKLPKVSFYQLKIKYDTLVVDEERDTAAEIEHSGDNTKIENIVRTTDFSMQTQKLEVIREEKGNIPATFSGWIYNIAKSSFNTIKLADLNKYANVLKSVFDRITYKKDDVTYFSSLYDKGTVEANIRKAFYEKRDFITVEELVPDEASLLNISNFSNSVLADDVKSYYPPQDTVENIIKDDNGKLKADEKTQNIIEYLEKTGDFDIAKQLRSKISSHPQKNRSFHYLPYHTDSNFEQKFLSEVLTLDEIEKYNLEVYYNGDRSLTEFKIKCYKSTGGKWSYIGMYTPDFLIIKRKDNQINKAIIVETKGEIYGKDPKFQDKRYFTETAFVTQNNKQYGYDRFSYLYLEDTLTEDERIKMTHRKICEFFKDTK